MVPSRYNMEWHTIGFNFWNNTNDNNILISYEGYNNIN